MPHNTTYNSDPIIRAIQITRNWWRRRKARRAAKREERRRRREIQRMRRNGVSEEEIAGIQAARQRQEEEASILRAQAQEQARTRLEEHQELERILRMDRVRSQRNGQNGTQSDIHNLTSQMILYLFSRSGQSEERHRYMNLINQFISGDLSNDINQISHVREVNSLDELRSAMNNIGIIVNKGRTQAMPGDEYDNLECTICYTVIEENQMNEELRIYMGHKVMIRFGCNEHHVVCPSCAVNILESSEIGGEVGVCHLRCGPVRIVYIQPYFRRCSPDIIPIEIQV